MNEDNKLKMNLQYFAEEETSQDEGVSDVEETEETTDEPEVEEAKSLTAEDVQKMIQSETDKVRTEYSQQVKALEEEKEAMKKEKMTDDEQRQYDLEQLEAQLKDKESEVLNRELTIKTVDLLKEKDLPLEFREFLIADNEENTIEQVENFSHVWLEALEQAVDGRFKEGGRKVGTGTKTGWTKEQIMGIRDSKERIKRIQENEKLFN